MRKFVLLVLLCTFMVSSLTACWDAKEIDEWSYVYSIGLDKGVSNNLRFTYQVATQKEESGGGGGESSSGGGAESGGQKKYITISVDAPTFYAGVNLADASNSREMNYMHAKSLVIGEDLAREGVETFMNGIVRSRQIRRIMNIIIVKGKASEFLEEFNPELAASVSKAQEGFILTSDESSLFFNTTYNDFLKEMKTTYRQPAAPIVSMTDFSNYKESGTPRSEFKSEGDYLAGETPRKGGNKFEFFGTALFDGDKMVGQLNGDETRALFMLNGEFERASIAIADPLDKKLRITMDTKEQKKPDIKVTFHEGKPVIHVKVFLEADIQNLQSPTEYESVKLKPVLENAFKSYIKGNLDKTIDKCKSLNVDVFGFGEKAVMHFLTIQEWENYDWLSKFRDAEVTTEVEFTIRRTGTLLKTNPSRRSQGENK